MLGRGRRAAPVLFALSLVALSLAFVAAGCAPTRDSPGTLLSLEDEPAGDNCANGGVRIQSGPDLNRNGTLEGDEARMTRYVCDGAGGGNSAAPYLTQVSQEPTGPACADGGVKIEVGQDTNGNGSLDPVEITSTEVACNGSSGGGASPLTGVTTEPSGANCVNGGTRLDSGRDTNGNGTLDSAEVTSTSYVCNGGGGDGTSSLTAVSNEPSGGNCSDGGVRIQTGPDTNGNGTLESGEATSTSYVCNGAPGAGGGVSGTGATAYTEASITSSDSPITLQSATITTAGAGTILAVGSVDIFCSSSGAPACNSSNPTDYYVRLTPTASDDPTTGDQSYGFLDPNVTSSVTRSGVFTVPGAGTWSVHMRGQGAVFTGGGAVGFYRRNLSLVFIPD